MSKDLLERLDASAQRNDCAGCADAAAYIRQLLAEHRKELADLAKEHREDLRDAVAQARADARDEFNGGW